MAKTTCSTLEAAIVAGLALAGCGAPSDGIDFRAGSGSGAGTGSSSGSGSSSSSGYNTTGEILPVGTTSETEGPPDPPPPDDDDETEVCCELRVEPNPDVGSGVGGVCCSVDQSHMGVHSIHLVPGPCPDLVGEWVPHPDGGQTCIVVNESEVAPGLCSVTLECWPCPVPQLPGGLGAVAVPCSASPGMIGD